MRTAHLLIPALALLLSVACAHSPPLATPQMDEGFVDVNGVRLHYVSQGNGPLILFLHGFPEFWYAWRNQLAEFGRDNRAVAIDMRGYNLSSKPSAVEDYRIAKLIEDIGAVADHFGAQKFVLVGHDWGGGVAWAFALTHPERLEKLVIINAPHPATFARELSQNPAQQRASAYMLEFRAPGAEAALSSNNFAALRAGVSELFTADHFTDADRAAYLHAWSQPGALTGGLNYYRASRLVPPTASGAAAFPSLASLPQLHVSVPTLVIWGDRDRYLLSSNLTGLEQFVPNLTVKHIPEGTHWVVHERPTEVNEAIRAFLR